MKKTIEGYLDFPRYLDTAHGIVKAPATDSVKSFTRMLPDSTRLPVFERAVSLLNSIRSGQESSALLYENEQKDLRLHLIAWHDKITMSLACLVLFLIGAPLGSIIRKGGIGLPVIFAVIFFVIFFLLNNFGEKFVKQEVMVPVAGKWMATFVLLPVGFFLTYKALNDSQLFNREFYFRMLKNIRNLMGKL